MSKLKTESKTKRPNSVWYLYLIRNKLNQLYCGITTDVDRRFQEHATASPKGAKAIKGKGPLILEYSIKVGDKSTASKLEFRTKKLQKRHKEKLIIDTTKDLNHFIKFLDCHLCKG